MATSLRNWLLVGLLAVQGSCYPKGADYIDDLDLVYTNYTSDFDFKATKTYSVPDSIVKITGNNISDPDGDGKPEYLSDASADIILNYPSYWYPPYITGYRSGSIFTQMVDNRQAPWPDTAPVVWTSIINGLAEGGTSSIAARAQVSIDKAFSQSPYLKH